MNEVVLAPDEVDDYVRPKVDHILVSGRRNTSVTLHIERGDEMEPVCSAHSPHGWVEKSVAIYPPDYAPFCSRCAEDYFGIEVSDHE